MNKKDFINKVFITKSSLETRKLGEDFARFHLTALQGETLIIALYGDLGSGKTTFVQGLAKGLGIKQRIISPTFIIVRCYELQIQNHNVKLRGNNVALRNSKLKSLERFYHIDLYRTESKKDIEGLGIEEIINNKNNIVVIEWAEKLKSFLPKKRIDIKFSYEKESVRKVAFSLTI